MDFILSTPRGTRMDASTAETDTGAPSGAPRKRDFCSLPPSSQYEFGGAFVTEKVRVTVTDIMYNACFIEYRDACGTNVTTGIMRLYGGVAKDATGKELGRIGLCGQGISISLSPCLFLSRCLSPCPPSGCCGGPSRLRSSSIPSLHSSPCGVHRRSNRRIESCFARPAWTR